MSGAIESVPASAGKKRSLWFAALAVVIALGATGYWVYWDRVGSRYVSTDNAYTAADSAQVTAEIEGSVARVEVVDTQKVKKGDILVTIDPTDTKLALRTAEAERDRARAQLWSAKATLERANIDLKRREGLVGSGSVSADELTAVKNAHANAKAAWEAALAAEDQADARCERIHVDLTRTIIRSPVDGVVARRQVQLGQRIQPGLPLLSVVPLHEMYVNANFKEVELQKVRPGQTVKLVSDIYGKDVEYLGVVEGFSGGTGAAFSLIPAQNATGNWIKVVQRLPVRIRLNPQELDAHPLRVGLSMLATVDVRGNTQ